MPQFLFQTWTKQSIDFYWAIKMFKEMYKSNWRTILSAYCQVANTVTMQTTGPYIHDGGFAGSIVTKQWGYVPLIEGNIKVLNSHSVTIQLRETMECDAHRELCDIFHKMRGKSQTWQRQRPPGNQAHIGHGERGANSNVMRRVVSLAIPCSLPSI